MARRIQGALLIIGALAPLMLLLVVVVSSLITTGAISRATGTYRDRVRAEIDTARQAFAQANEGLTALNTYVTAVKNAVGAVAGTVARIASSITVPLPDPLPQLPPVQIPGVAEFKRVVADVAAAGRVVGREVAKVTALAVVPAQLGNIRTATYEFAGEVRSAVVRWIGIVVGVLLMAVVAWFLASLARVAGEVRRGWALLRGVVPPPLAVADLQRQLDDLRQQVAAAQGT
ncbi:MAG: hypothetical protein ACREMR_05455 [Gemmatimonadales bacterium]